MSQLIPYLLNVSALQILKQPCSVDTWNQNKMKNLGYNLNADIKYQVTSLFLRIYHQILRIKQHGIFSSILRLMQLIYCIRRMGKVIVSVSQFVHIRRRGTGGTYPGHVQMERGVPQGRCSPQPGQDRGVPQGRFSTAKSGQWGRDNPRQVTPWSRQVPSWLGQDEGKGTPRQVPPTKAGSPGEVRIGEGVSQGRWYPKVGTHPAQGLVMWWWHASCIHAGGPSYQQRYLQLLSLPPVSII